MSGNILVTGGAGFIGSHLVEALQSSGLSGRLVVADALRMGALSNVRFLNAEQVAISHADITDYSTLSQVLCKYSIDTVLHLATLPLVYSVWEPVVSFGDIVKMQHNLLECQRKQMFRRLIAFSTSEVYGGSPDSEPITEATRLCPRTPYAAAKASADMLALSYVNSYGLDVTIVRPFNNFGPRKQVMRGGGIIPTAIDRLSRGLPVPLYGGGQTTREFVYVTDTVRAVLAILKSTANLSGEVIQIATGQARTMRSIVCDLAEQMGVEPKIEDLPARQGDVDRLLGSGEKARRLLGFEPTTKWEDGLRECIEYYTAPPGSALQPAAAAAQG